MDCRCTPTQLTPTSWASSQGSVFQGSTVNNLLPPGDYYYRYELVEGVRSMLSAALEGAAALQRTGAATIKITPSQYYCISCLDVQMMSGRECMCCFQETQCLPVCGLLVSDTCTR